MEIRRSMKMSKLDLSYFDNIKNGIVKGLGECNLMSDLGYTATCVEVLQIITVTQYMILIMMYIS